jgi:adenine-specific DNA methylase
MLTRFCSAIFAGSCFLASSVTLAGNDIINENDPQTYNSRYKIFTAEHEAVTKGGTVVKVKSIFKIDLETGTVWRYRQGVDQKGKPFEEFFEVPNQ